MSGTNDNYENRYLEEIKSKGFIQKLKHDAKSKNCAASRRLYTRVKKSFKNKDKKRRLNKNDNILLYNTMARNGNAKYTRNKNCAGNFVLDVNLVNIQNQTLGGPSVGSETYTGSQQFMKSSLIQTTTKEKVSSWLSYNIENVSPTPLHVDPHKAMDNYSDIYPPSYSFKDNYSPVSPNQQKINVFHVEKGKPNDALIKEHVLGVTDDNFRSSGGNDLNHKIHQCIWCPCFFFFTVLCCIPAILLMTKADKYFLKNDLKEAAWHQKMSTTLYVGGFIATILFYIAIALFIVCFM